MRLHCFFCVTAAVFLSLAILAVFLAGRDHASPSTETVGTRSLSEHSGRWRASGVQGDFGERQGGNIARPHDGPAPVLDVVARGKVEHAYFQLPLSFEVNLGQTDPAVAFFSRGPGFAIFLTRDSAFFEFQTVAPETAKLGGWGKQQNSPPHDPLSPQHSETLAGRIRLVPTTDPLVNQCSPSCRRHSVVLQMRLANSNPSVQIGGIKELPGRTNYIIGRNPANWRTNIPSYAGVKYTDVYPGIDLVYYGNRQQLEYDFVVSPDGDPGNVRLSFVGADKLEKDRTGDLIITRLGEQVRVRRPIAYQMNGQDAKLIDCDFTIGGGEVTFHLGDYNATQPLIIDPIMVYSTYLGGKTPADSGRGIAVDGDGNAYVTGTTRTAAFPIINAVQPTLGDPFFDAYVTKFNSSGSALIFSTFLGGNGDDFGNGIALNDSGNVYVAGQTSSSQFPTVAAVQPTFGGSTDAFVAKLSSTGSALMFASYLGGSGSDAAFGIAVDGHGDAHVTGTTPGGFPVISAFQPVFGGGPSDAFLAKINSAGSPLFYSTYLGGSGRDFGTGVGLDGTGNTYLTGVTSSSNFPTANPLQASRSGSDDAFVAKLNPSGSALVYATYLGGAGSERSNGIAIDDLGSVYITGRTASTNFPVASPIQGPATLPDAFIAKLNSVGSAIVFSTYVGGDAFDEGRAIVVDGSRSVEVAGITSSTNFPVVGPLQTALRGASDVFISKLDPAGSALVFSTYLGGSSTVGGSTDDVANSIAGDTAGSIYVTGLTYSTDFPTKNAFQSAPVPTSSSATTVTFVAKIAVPDAAPSPVGTPIPTLSDWGIISLALLLAAVGTWYLKRRRPVYFRRF